MGQMNTGTWNSNGECGESHSWPVFMRKPVSNVVIRRITTPKRKHQNDSAEGSSSLPPLPTPATAGQCSFPGCTLPEKHAGIHKILIIPEQPRLRKHSKPSPVFGAVFGAGPSEDPDDPISQPSQ